MEINLLNRVYQDFMVIIEKSVIKMNTLADVYETLEIRKAADAFVRASLAEDVFETYLRYDEYSVGVVMGLTDEDEIEEYASKPRTIPEKYREQLLIRQRKKIISEYVEENNYYRQMLGLPNIEEKEEDFIYLDPTIAEEYNLPSDVPVHEFTDPQLSILESVGLLSDLIDKYPTKGYLKFLGPNKVDLVIARTASNFGIIKIPTAISDTMFNSFTLIYDQCREYYMSCVYIKEYRDTIDYYDNFIGIMIMLMTMQQIMSRQISYIIERDFFDDYSIKILFDNYGVPYHTNMDPSTRKILVQRLNLLILDKGTNEVIYNIGQILGYDKLQIYKYYLIKEQKFDIDGTPIVEYKEDPITGETVLDYEKMFDIYFQKVEIRDLDTYKSIIDHTMNVSYRQIVQNDPFWVEDDEFYKELYESEYNFMETKYLGVSVSYKMTNIIFENIHVLRMILDKKDEISFIKVDLPKISLNTEIPLFDAIVTLCAMTCKINHLKGNILTDPSKILSCIGFNFNLDFEAIRQDILNNEYIDDSLDKYFVDTTTFTAERINTVYENFIALRDFLIDKMRTVQDIDAYHAYKDLYNTIFYTKESREMFNIGTIEHPIYANTYMDYLAYAQRDIYDFINNTEIDQLYVYTNHICNKILQIIPNLKNLGIYSDTSSTMEKMLVDLINFFKSYTVDMINLRIVYILDLKPESLIRLIDLVRYRKINQPHEILPLAYSDNLRFIATDMYDTAITMRALLDTYVSNLYLYGNKDKMMYMYDKVSGIRSSSDLKEFLSIMDIPLARKEIIVHNKDLMLNDAMTINAVERPTRYTVKIDKNNSSPTGRITYMHDAVGMTPAYMDYSARKFNYGDWKDVWFVKDNYPVMLKSDGTVDYKLNPNNYNKKENGTNSDVANVNYDGNAMSRFPKVYLSFTEDDNYEYISVSDTKYDETYEAIGFINDNGEEVNEIFLAMFEGSYDGSKLRSLSGYDTMNRQTASDEISRAKANGTGWYTRTWAQRQMVNALLTIISKSDNSQAAFGNGIVGASALTATGRLNTAGQFHGYSNKYYPFKVFHMENWWGNLQEKVAGLINYQGTIYVKMHGPYNDDPANSTDLTGYTPVFIYDNTIVDYIKTCKCSNTYGRLPIGTGGSSSTYLCDYLYMYYRNGTGVSEFRYPMVGGGYYSDTLAGASFLQLFSAANVSNSGNGAALSYISQS